MNNTIETILQKADFSKESNHRNLLFYELFHKPIPVPAETHGKTALSFEALGAIAGGNQERPDFETFRTIAAGMLVNADEAQLRQLYEKFLAASRTAPISAEAFLKSAKELIK